MFHNIKLSMFHNKKYIARRLVYKYTTTHVSSAYVFLLQVQVEAVVTVSTKYDVAYKYLKAKREKSDDGKIYKEIFVAWTMLNLNQHTLCFRAVINARKLVI